MKETDSITEGIREMLFGAFRPDRVLQRYQSGDQELCHRLLEIPTSPDDYLHQNEIIKSRWRGYLSKENSDEWMDPFYSLPDNIPEPFHILCTFYRIFIYCECRMFIQVMEGYRNNLELTLLKYELVILQNQLVGYLKECNFRMSADHPDIDTIQNRLNQYLTVRLFNQLLMSFFELRIRYGHIVEERIISKEELYLKHLERPVPIGNCFYRTPVLTTFELVKIVRPPAGIEAIEGMLRQVKKEYSYQNNEDSKTELLKSIHILENVWLLTVICVEDGEELVADIPDIETAGAKINRWRKGIRSGDIEMAGDDETAEIHRLLRHIPEIKSELYFDSPGKKSEAVNLILEIEDLFDPAAGSGGMSEELRSQSGAVLSRNTHWLLDQYIALDSIVEKIGVTMKSLRKYIRKNGTEIIELTAKNRWMHVDDFTAFMDQHRTKM